MKEPKVYTESLLYQMELTSRYFRYLANQIFKKLNIEISPDNYAVLDILRQHPDICQRDLAKLILKDRANTGKIINNLEKLGYIKRIIDTRGKRLIKKLSINEKGSKYLDEISKKIKGKLSISDKQLLLKEREQIITSLKIVREILKGNLETNI